MNRQAAALVLVVVIAGILLFGKGKLPRAWAAMWGPRAADSSGEAADAQTLAKGVLGFGVAALIAVAVSDTPAYPAMLGILVIAALYLMISGGGLAAVAYLDKTLTGGKKA